jgi:hypothetical protein
MMILSKRAVSLTLCCFEVGKVPHEFADEEALASELIERFEVL